MMLWLNNKCMARILGLCCLALLFSACSITDRISYEDSEGPLPDSLFDNIKANKTTKAWVIDQLGEPHAIEEFNALAGEISPAYQVYTYQVQRRRVRGGHLLFLFRAATVEETLEYLHLSFEQGVVTRKWIDRFERTQLRIQRKARDMTHPVEVSAGEFVEKKKGFDWKIPAIKKWLGIKGLSPTRKSVSSSLSNNTKGDIKTERSESSEEFIPKANTKSK